MQKKWRFSFQNRISLFGSCLTSRYENTLVEQGKLLCAVDMTYDYRSHEISRSAQIQRPQFIFLYIRGSSTIPEAVWSHYIFHLWAPIKWFLCSAKMSTFFVLGDPLQATKNRPFTAPTALIFFKSRKWPARKTLEMLKGPFSALQRSVKPRFRKLAYFPIILLRNASTNNMFSGKFTM